MLVLESDNVAEPIETTNGILLIPRTDEAMSHHWLTKLVNGRIRSGDVSPKTRVLQSILLIGHADDNNR